MKKEQFLLEKQQVEKVQIENQKLITESQNRVMHELSKTESNVEKSIKEENLANRERVLNESLLKLEYDEQRVSQKKK